MLIHADRQVPRFFLAGTIYPLRVGLDSVTAFFERVEATLENLSTDVGTRASGVLGADLLDFVVQPGIQLWGHRVEHRLTRWPSAILGPPLFSSALHLSIQ